MTAPTDALRALEVLASEEAFLRIAHGDDTANEHMAAVATLRSALATPAGSASGEDAPVPLTEWQQLVAERDALQAEVARLREDAARLDWLLEYAATVKTDGDGNWFVCFDYMPEGEDRGPNAPDKRAAIDAAIQGSANGQG